LARPRQNLAAHRTDASSPIVFAPVIHRAGQADSSDSPPASPVRLDPSGSGPSHLADASRKLPRRKTNRLHESRI